MTASDSSVRLSGASDGIVPVGLTGEQNELLRRYQDLLFEWNAKVNLVSRKLTKDDLWHHIVHCLALTQRAFPKGARVVDWGAGGGLPTIPLAIVNPGARFAAIDATRKKVDAVNDMARRLGLVNVVAVHTRAEEWKGQAGWSVSRATAPLATLWSWHRSVALASAKAAADSSGAADEVWPRGLLALKGGDLTNELVELSKIAPGARAAITELHPELGPAFAGKVIVAVTAGPDRRIKRHLSGKARRQRGGRGSGGGRPK